MTLFFDLFFLQCRFSQAMRIADLLIALSIIFAVFHFNFELSMAPKNMSKDEKNQTQQIEQDAAEIEQSGSGYASTVAMASSTNPATLDDQAIAEPLAEVPSSEVMVVSEQTGITISVADSVREVRCFELE